MFELVQSVVTQNICIKQMAMTFIKENCSIGTRNFANGFNNFSSPFAKANGFVVSVKSEATPLIIEYFQTNHMPAVMPSMDIDIMPNDQITCPFVKNS